MIDVLRIAWIGVNIVAAVLTAGALLEARRDTEILRQFNGSVRGVVARATVRRETFRLGSQLGLLIAALPLPAAVRLVAAMSVPIFILLNTLSDRKMRDTLEHKTEEEIAAERDASLSRLEARLNKKADARAEDLQTTADETAVQVSEIHDATVPGAES